MRSPRECKEEDQELKPLIFGVQGDVEGPLKDGEGEIDEVRRELGENGVLGTK